MPSVYNKLDDWFVKMLLTRSQVGLADDLGLRTTWTPCGPRCTLVSPWITPRLCHRTPCWT
eukprot:9556908-Prorocentrum_lima.AAC.1